MGFGGDGGEAGAWVDADWVLDEAEHGQVGGAVRVRPRVLGVAGEQAGGLHGREFGGVFVIGAVDFRDEWLKRADDDRGAESVVEAEDAGDFADAEIGAGGVEHEGAAVASVAVDFGGEFRVDQGWDDGFGEFAGQVGEAFGGHEPEVAEEDAFEFAGVEDAEQSGGRKGGGERQEEPAQAMAFEDKLAEEQLGVVGEQGAIKVEEGESGHGGVLGRSEIGGECGCGRRGVVGELWRRRRTGPGRCGRHSEPRFLDPETPNSHAAQTHPGL